MLLAAAGMNAQTTHIVDWFMGVSTSETNITIQPGDIVTWMWADNAPHTVTSTGGTDTFTSGMLTGNGSTYSHTFNTIGNTSYHCNVHTMMQGVITVSGTAGVNDTRALAFEFYPNPTTDVLTINAKENIDKVELYDVNGRLLMAMPATTPTVKLYMAGVTAGTYFVKVSTATGSKSLSVIKQ